MSPSTTESTKLDLEQVAQTYFAAWEARDADRIANLHAVDTQFCAHAAGREPVRGREAVRENFTEFLQAWPDFAFEVERVLFGKGHWVLDWTLVSSDGPFGDVRLDCLDVVTVNADGLVQRKDMYLDMTALAAKAE